MQEFSNSKDLGVHDLFFADDLGIASIFPALKYRLADPRHQHISLFYCSLNNQHTFRKELAILQQYFPTQLFVSYHSKGITALCTIPQEDIEAILNANTMPTMNFIISGSEAFVHTVRTSLLFLGIENVQIQEQYFSE